MLARRDPTRGAPVVLGRRKGSNRADPYDIFLFHPDAAHRKLLTLQEQRPQRPDRRIGPVGADVEAALRGVRGRGVGASRQRPAYRQLFADAHRRFDLLLFWALDRFSREGALETLQSLQRLTSYGVGWKSLTEEYLDSAGVFKDAIVSIMATLAKQERVKISERTRAGLARARAQGKQLGRPKKIFDRQKAIEMRRMGASLGAIAQAVGVSRSLAFRVTRECDLGRG